MADHGASQSPAPSRPATALVRGDTRSHRMQQSQHSNPFDDSKATTDERLGLVSWRPPAFELHATISATAVWPANTYPELAGACEKLKLTAAFTMRCEVAQHVLEKLKPGQTEMAMGGHDTILPVVESLHELATTDTSVVKRDYACLVRQEGVVLLWAQSMDGLMQHASQMEDTLMGSLWGVAMPTRRMMRGMDSMSPRRSVAPSLAPSDYAPSRDLNSFAVPTVPSTYHYTSDKAFMGTNTPQVDVKTLDTDEMSVLDAEDQEALGPIKRPFILTHSLMIGLASCLIIAAQSVEVGQILLEVHALGREGLNRLAMLATVPIFLFFGLFFFTILVVCVFQLVGPIQDIKTGKSKFYSAVKPDRKKHPNIEWPHITIQMPVYKEGLKGVIQPTVRSLLPAIAHYEQMGGSANIFVCEDGMQVVSPEIAQLRKDFYEANGIGWVARPPHNKDGFVRAGRFKKASNMNYALDFTLRLEEELTARITARRHELGWADDDFEHQLDLDEEDRLYDDAMAKILADDQGKTWAEGNVRMGDIILIVDSDTQVPVDCLHLAALEMEESPEVAIIQHASGVMQVTHSWFENAITYFTNLVYKAIAFSVGNGDMAAFVGHNAFLRWKALQSIRFKSDDGTRDLFWSESHVSEDFDVALRLQTNGFIVRLATYHNGDFKEGVSLTIFDELLRWEKYAYGCSELLFNPIHKWIYKGIFTPMVWKILTSNIKTTAKFTIFGYIGTYYAIASAFPLSLLNYFVIGWYATEVDQVYVDSWRLFPALVAMFQVISPICYAIYRHRVGDANFFRAYWEGLKWNAFFIVFFGGLSWHLSYALLAHLFSLPIEWASTAKEIEAGGFFVSIENVWKTYKWVIMFNVPLCVGMVYLGQFAPYDWTINTFVAIVPLSTQLAGHLLLPLLSIL
ncbi:glycosyl transferase family group 2-domain-containing protein [Microdochium trichocladiopsis]|uniref:Glycosyl transferase family group 2-domain-containing protein n=1 Tax=Microdochium trichocladiopsis TaxID=1682393 RepID=A0A9P9BR06_9PEZI|nr:glycosyl transferase family group 2-domain-containing protein [Microdochium trichocladiopsis]KAH7031442.1 glycosyl transferase family group 2-domain-containing protein [Microdochium trichocladiopsis]